MTCMFCARLARSGDYFRPTCHCLRLTAHFPSRDDGKGRLYAGSAVDAKVS